MHYSEMNQLISIDEGCETIDECGEVVVIWKGIGKYLAKIEILFDKRRVGHEIALDRRIVNVNYFELTLRYIDLPHKIRILWDQKLLNVLKVFDANSNRKFTKIIVEEIK